MAAGFHTFAKGSVFTPERFQGDRFVFVGVRSNAFADDRKLKLTRDFQCATAFLYDAPEAGQPRRVEMYDPIRGELPFCGTHLIGIASYIFISFEHGLDPRSSEVTRSAKLLTKALGEITITFNDDNLVSYVTVPHQAFQIFADHHISTSQLLDFQPQLQRSDEFLELPHFFPIVGLIPGLEYPLIDLTSTPALLSALDVNMIPPSTSKPRPTTCIFYVLKSTERSNGKDEDNIVYHMMSIRGLGIDRTEELASSTGACTLGCHLAKQEGGSSVHHVFHFEQTVPQEDRTSTIVVEVKLEADGKTVKEVFLSGRSMFYYKGELHGPWH